MLEFSAVEAVLIRCFGEPSVLDSFPGLAGAAACRVADDELILLGAPAMKQELIEQATAHFESADPHALVIAHTDAWSFWAISGAVMRRAFTRLSENALPATSPAFIQGAIARLPAKALVLPDSILIMVPSTMGHHIRERIFAACADLNPRERAAQPFAIENAIVVTSRPARAAQVMHD